MRRYSVGRTFLSVIGSASGGTFLSLPSRPNAVCFSRSSSQGRQKCLPHRWLLALTLLFILQPSSFILAASLRTLDGKTYQGQITLEPGGQITGTDPRSDKPIKIELADVLEANFGGEAPKARPAAARVQAGQLPAPWEMLDIGNLAEKSSARLANDNTDTFSIK